LNEEKHGQRVASIFHDADFIVSLDAPESVQAQVTRFCELIFGSNVISPTKSEYGLFVAKAAALRTLDLSRQVGAAIFSPSGEVMALGSNEVPMIHPH
jgi:deoxycytidylate deaminase